MNTSHSPGVAAQQEKYGGRFEGIIPQLLSKYRKAKTKMHRRQLEKYMKRGGARRAEVRGSKSKPRAIT